MINLKNKTAFILLAFLILMCSFNVAYAGTSHAVIGYVEDSLDGTQANGATVTMYVSTRPSETLTDTVGPTGNSGSDNWYNVDVGNFPTPWSVGDEVEIEIQKDASHDVSTSVTLTSAGVDQASDTILPGSADGGGSSGGSSGSYSIFVIDFRTKNEYSSVYLSQVTPVTMILSDGKIFYVYFSVINNNIYVKVTRSLQYMTQSFEEGNDLNQDIEFDLNNIKQLNIVDGSQKEIEIELIAIDPNKKFRFKELNETEEIVIPTQPEEQEPTTPVEPTQPEQEPEQTEQNQQESTPNPIVQFFKNNWQKMVLTLILILLLVLIFEGLRKIFLIAKRRSDEDKKKKEQEKLLKQSQETQISQEQKPITQKEIEKPKQEIPRFKPFPQPRVEVKKPEPPKQEFKPQESKQIKQKPQKIEKPKRQFNLFSKLTKKQVLNPDFLQKLKKIDEDENRLKEINKRIKQLDKKIK